LKKVLLISYYFDPFKGVGAKRMSYWAGAFFEENGPFECTVITATPQTEPKPSIIYVEDKKSLWVDRFVQGISWVPDLKRFFDSQAPSFDYVIISGGPFGHFWITRYLKRKFDCKIILDFRDPFSRNSRFNTSFGKEYVKVLFEKIFMAHTDHIITVNEYCRNLLLLNAADKVVSVIENGYDEKVLDRIPTTKFDDGLIHVVYAGSFYEDRNPTLFIQSLLHGNKDNRKFVLHHIGSPSDFLRPFRGSESICEHGEKNYAQTMEIMKKCSIGLIITGGEPMESTTKIYDYIGCNLDILVITNGAIQTGSINDITSRVKEKVFWLRNEEADIAHFLRSHKSVNQSIPDRENFSRFHGYELLKEILRKI
jgi:glycosyltransferase involved in cell wall biosynthesis